MTAKEIAARKAIDKEIAALIVTLNLPHHPKRLRKSLLSWLAENRKNLRSEHEIIAHVAVAEFATFLSRGSKALTDVVRQWVKHANTPGGREAKDYPRAFVVEVAKEMTAELVRLQPEAHFEHAARGMEQELRMKLDQLDQQRLRAPIRERLEVELSEASKKFDRDELRAEINRLDGPILKPMVEEMTPLKGSGGVRLQCQCSTVSTTSGLKALPKLPKGLKPTSSRWSQEARRQCYTPPEQVMRVRGGKPSWRDRTAESLNLSDWINDGPVETVSKETAAKSLLAAGVVPLTVTKRDHKGRSRGPQTKMLKYKAGNVIGANKKAIDADLELRGLSRSDLTAPIFEILQYKDPEHLAAARKSAQVTRTRRSKTKPKAA